MLILRRLISYLALCILANAQTFQPELLWSKTLPGSGRITGAGLRKGNGVVLAGNEQSLWLTTESGWVHVLSLVDDGDLMYEPEQLDASYSTDCRSSVMLHARYDGSVDFAVYAVLDVPTLSSWQDVSSRIICLDSEANEIWTKPLDGIVQGTPLVSIDGTRVYVTHNTAQKAIMTVLDAADGSVIAELQDNRDEASFEYGPLSLAVDTNGDDRIYWGDATERGYAREGRVHELHSINLGQVDSRRSFSSSTTTAPTIGSDGSIWLGGGNATVLGWSSTSAKPVWKTKLNVSLRNETFPIVNRILAADETNRLFVSSASNSFHCLDGSTGTQIWSATVGPSVYLVGAQYSSTENALYTIQHLTGAVIQQDADTGEVRWQFNCRNFTSNPICYNSVEADFVLNGRGTVLYYGDVYGNVNALAVTESFPTASPSSSPSLAPSAAPSLIPSTMPSFAPSDITQVPSLAPSTSPTLQPVMTAEPTTQQPIQPRVDTSSSGSRSAASFIPRVASLVAGALYFIL